MADSTFRWRKQVPQELAQFAIPTPPEALRWPHDRNRLDMQAQKGRRGVVQQLYQQLYESGLIYEESVFESQSTVVQQIRTPPPRSPPCSSAAPPAAGRSS